MVFKKFRDDVKHEQLTLIVVKQLYNNFVWLRDRNLFIFYKNVNLLAHFCSKVGLEEFVA